MDVGVSIDKAVLVAVAWRRDDLLNASDSLDELARLADTAGVTVVDKLKQELKRPHPATLIGSGKIEEVKLLVQQHGANLVIFDDELTPAQQRNLEKGLGVRIIDRTQLILDIFAQRAQSREGKIQVELAQLKYLLPRLVVGQNSAFSRLAGGIGGRGPGETKLETDRRRVRDRINRLEKEIEHLRQRRQERRKERTRREFPVVSIVGYTNAGKSTLLNTLTSSRVLAEQRMFATLDPTSRHLRLPRDQEVIINDTVGFIRDLPPSLIAAFRATIEEISDSDLLLHLVDASSPRWEQQIESVDRILTELQFGQIPRVVVFNKADLLGADELEAILRQTSQGGARDVVALSALDAATLGPLIERIGAILARDLSGQTGEAPAEVGPEVHAASST